MRPPQQTKVEMFKYKNILYFYIVKIFSIEKYMSPLHKIVYIIVLITEPSFTIMPVKKGKRERVGVSDSKRDSCVNEGDRL